MRRRAVVGAGAIASGLLLVSLAGGAVIQRDNLRITVQAQIKPYKLPRQGVAPIAVFVSGRVATADGSVPEQLQRMSVLVNRRGRLQSAGLPTCRLAEIDAVSSQRSLAACGDALVGSGRFWASIVLPDQRPYPTRGRLLVFNGRQQGRPVLFAHIYTVTPFATSFVIAFRVRDVDKGPYGTELSASLPEALGSWGFVDRIKLTLRRKYMQGGEQRSYFNAGCPAPAGTAVTAFPLAYVSFSFSGRKSLGLGISKSCRVVR